MKNLKSYMIFVAMASLMAVTGCKEENNLHPWGGDKLVGDLGKVTEVSSEGTPGGAVITYRLPDSKDLLYVKAIYTVGQDRRMETRASKYDSSLVLYGFGDTEPREVSLYCVDKMENVGEEVRVSVTPLTPPLVTVYESLDMGATAGGVSVGFDNPSKSDIAIHIETLDAEGYLYEKYVHYTNSASGRFAVRGFPAISRPFGMYVTDRWGNRTETITEYYTPQPERQIDKSKFAEYNLPGDLVCNAWGGSLSYAWNDDFTPAKFVHSPGGDEFPAWFTFDMGQTVVLSRFVFYHLFMQEHAFQRGNLKTWEVWGTNETPPADGSWDGWTKLLDCESHKPSGLPVGQITGEDWEYLQNGEEFEFSNAMPVRYIRFKVLETWGGDDFIHFTEFTFYGDY